MPLTLLPIGRNRCRPLASSLPWIAAFGVGVSFLGHAPARAEYRDDKKDTAYLLKRVYKAGDTDRYRLTTKMNTESPVGAVAIVLTMILKDSTREANADGGSTSFAEFESATIKVNGANADMTQAAPKVTTVRDKEGKVTVKPEGGDAQASSQLSDQLKQYASATTALMHAKQVKVGESWDVDSADFGVANQQSKGKATLVSVDTVKGFQLAKVKTAIDITGTMTKMHFEGTTLFDVTTGKPMDLTAKVKGDMSGAKFSMDMALKMLTADLKGNLKDAL